MLLSDKALKDFKELYLKEYSIVLTDNEALEYGGRLIGLLKAVYGNDFIKEVSQTKICLGFSVNPDTWGYWSNRVGKTLTVGGFLLQRYVPGMELFLRDGADYFSSIEEAREKIDYYLKFPQKREEVAQRGYEIGRDRFTSEARIKELMILIDRFKKGAFLR